MKYCVVTGGVVSGLGKGISSSSIGVLLKEAGLHVTCIKIDPYLNIDAGTMSPYEHGEVYVLDDGGEVDLDLGNYERFLATRLTRDHNITTGKVYAQVLENERRGDYLGKTVQVVPHVTNCIQDWIHRAAHHPIDSTMPAYDDDHHSSSNNASASNAYSNHDHSKRGKRPDVCMIELGGTVGDIESMVFLEAIRQFKYRIGEDNLCHVHVSLVPVVGAVGEPKSKPTQHSVKELRAAGLSPDIILCRSGSPLERDVIAKISLFCMVPPSHVISVHDVSNIYRVPLLLHEQRVTNLVLNKLRLNKMPPEDIPLWRHLASKTDSPTQVVNIALVGKYTGLGDSYLSITKALSHAGIHADVKLNVTWIDSQHLEEAWKHRSHSSSSMLSSKHPHSVEDHATQHNEAWQKLKAADGILVPGGFGDRGAIGKILAINYARTSNVPFFGICLGFQMAVIEYARNVLGLEGATSEEFEPEAADKVIMYMPEISHTHMGGTMRLGGRHSDITANTLAEQIYEGRRRIFERHRHRYEVNPEYIEFLTDPSHNKGPGTGLVFSAKDSDTGKRMECLELNTENHRYFFGCQYHPEFTSRPAYPNPIFLTFVQASAGKFERRQFQRLNLGVNRLRASPSNNSLRSTSPFSPHSPTAENNHNTANHDSHSGRATSTVRLTEVPRHPVSHSTSQIHGIPSEECSQLDGASEKADTHGEKAKPVTLGAEVGLHTRGKKDHTKNVEKDATADEGYVSG